MSQKTCVSDAIRLWNMAPEIITKSSSLLQAKTEIKSLSGTCRSNLILSNILILDIRLLLTFDTLILAIRLLLTILCLSQNLT